LVPFARRQADFERTRADHGFVFDRTRELHGVGFELSRELALRVHGPDLGVTVHRASGADRQRRRVHVTLYATADVDRTRRREVAGEMRALFDHSPFARGIDAA